MSKLHLETFGEKYEDANLLQKLKSCNIDEVYSDAQPSILGHIPPAEDEPSQREAKKRKINYAEVKYK